jgi:hypothetical protein
MHAKMQSDKGKETYNRRMHIGETPFAVIKAFWAAVCCEVGKVRTDGAGCVPPII